MACVASFSGGLLLLQILLPQLRHLSKVVQKRKSSPVVMRSALRCLALVVLALPAGLPQRLPPDELAKSSQRGGRVDVKYCMS